MSVSFAAVAGASPAAFTDIRYQRRRGILIGQGPGGITPVTVRRQAAGVARCYTPGFGWGACTFLDPDDAPRAVREAHELSLAVPVRVAGALPPVPARELDLDLVAGHDPDAVPLERKLALIRRLAGAVHAADRRIAECRIQYQDWIEETTVVSSEGLDLTERRPALELSVLAAAHESGTTERAVDGHATAGDWEALERWADSAHTVAHRAVLLLHAPPVRAGRYPVVLDPRAAGVLAHRVVGHLCAADDRSHPAGPLPMGTRLGPDPLTIGDDATAHGLRGTMAFDHEGMLPRATTLVQHGVVVAHLHTRASAARAGVGPTGNARADGPVPPVARLSNSFIAGGRGELHDLLRDVDEGLYVTEPVGAALDAGQASLRSGFSRMIRRGSLAEPVKGVTLAGDPLTLLGLVDRVGGDFQWDVSATWCARAGAGRVPVTVGAPHLRLVDVPVSDGA